MLTRRKTKIEVIIYILIPSSDSQSKPKLPINQTIKKKGLTCYEILKVCKQLNIFKYGIASDGFNNVLCSLFNKYFEMGYFPESWSEGLKANYLFTKKDLLMVYRTIGKSQY